MNTETPKRGRPPIEGETASEQIQLRVKPSRRKAYMRAKLLASPDPKKPISLANWIFGICDKAAGYQSLPH